MEDPKGKEMGGNRHLWLWYTRTHGRAVAMVIYTRLAGFGARQH